MSLAWYEYPFYWTGLTTPGMRFLGVFTLANGIILFSKPQFAFTKRGEFKSWTPTSTNINTNMNTYTPWWLPGLALGAASAIFI
jgi:hypothetical protein